MVLVAAALVVQALEIVWLLHVQMLRDALGILVIRQVIFGIGTQQEDLEAQDYLVLLQDYQLEERVVLGVVVHHMVTLLNTHWLL